LTPWQFRQYFLGHVEAARRQHDQAAWMMWHCAALTRSDKQLPPLKDFLSSRKNSVKRIDEAAIMQQLRLYQGSLNGNGR
jgi:hypothetical protein